MLWEQANHALRVIERKSQEIGSLTKEIGSLTKERDRLRDAPWWKRIWSGAR
jgi:hypothetical protein